MTLIANSKASLSAGLNSTKNQPAVSNASGGGSSTFSLALDDTDSDFVSQMDLDGLVPISKSALETAVLELDDASKDNHAAPVADAVWLANWFQKNAPATASSPAPSLGSSSAPVEPAQVETASKPVATPSSELIALIGVPISDQSKKSPSVLPDKPASAQAPSSATAPLTAAVSLPLPTPSAAQAIFQQTAQTATQPVAQFASIGVGFWDSRSPKNLPNDSGLLRPVDGLSKAPLDIAGSVKLGQSVGFKEIKDFENDRGLTVTIGSSQISLDVHTGANLPQQVVGTEAVSPAFNQDAQWTSNLADTVNQWVERSLQLAELTVPDAGQDSLQVRIELNGQEATVYFLTDHAQYRDAIESQIENLSDRLADQGLKLAGSFVGQGSSQNSPQEQSAHSMLSRRHESEPASAKVLSIDPVLRDLKSVHQGRVLDVFA